MKIIDLGKGQLRPGYRWQARRIRILRVNPEILGMLCLRSASYKVTSGLPGDARCLAAHVDINSGDIFLKIESEEYEPVEQGAMVPVLDAGILVIEKIQPRKDIDSLLCDMLKRPQGE